LTNTVVTGTDCAWTITYTYNVVDACGNSFTGRTYQNTGSDQTAPTLTGAPYAGLNGVNSCIANAVVTAPWVMANAILGYTDNCGAPVTAVLTNTVVTGTDCAWTITYTYNVVDACGNSITGQTYQNTGSDQTAPTQAFQGFYAPTNWTILGQGNGYVDLTGIPSSVTLFGSNSGTASNLNVDMTIEIPADGMVRFDWSYQSFNTDAFYDPFGYVLNGVFTNLTVIQYGPTSLSQSGTASVAVTSGDVFGFRQNTRDDILGRGVTTVTGLAIPNEPIVNTDACFAGAYTAAPFDASHATSTYVDNCGGIVTAVKTGESITGDDCDWTITYTYNVVDVCGNSVTGQTYTHSGSDQTAPTGTQPAAQTGTDACFVNAYTAAPFDAAHVTATYGDNCGASVTAVKTGESITGDDCGWTITYTYNIVDACGNSLTGETYTRSGSDQTAPTGTPPVAQTGTNACFVDAYTAAPFNPTLAASGYTDNCGGTVTAIETDKSIVGNNCSWTITYTFNVVDVCGNSITGQVYTHSGSDQNPATGITPAGQTLVDACANEAEIDSKVLVSADIAALELAYTDDCGTVTATFVSQVLTGNDCNWSLARTYNITDGCPANDFLVVITHTGSDQTPPVINTSLFPTVTAATLPAGATGCNALYQWPVPAVGDNCDLTPVLTLTFSDPTVTYITVGGFHQALFNKGVTTVIYTLRDACNNVSTASFIVTVNDVTPPTISGVPANITVNNTPGQCYATVSWTAPTASDNCPGVSLATTHAPGTIFPVGTTTVTYTATDGVGLVTTASFTVTVLDNEPIQLVGTIPGGPVGNVCIANAPVAPTVAAIAALFTDNCGPIVATQISSSVTGTDCNWIATYQYNVDNSHGQNYLGNPVVVVYTGGDTEAPSLIDPLVTTATLNQSNINQCYATAQLFNPATLEAAVKALYEDNCAVTATITAVWVNTVDPVTNDDCGWTLEYVFDITDACFNTTTASVFYSGSNQNDPVWAVALPVDETLNCNDDLTPATLTANSFCGGAANVALNTVSTKGTNPAACDFYSYTLTHTWTATDVCNKVTSTTQVVTVQDVTDPWFVTTPATATIYTDVNCDYDASPANTNGYPTVADNCMTTPTVTYSDAPVAGSCVGSWTITRTWLVEDACGNSDTYDQTIYVEDNIKPVLVGVPADVTVSCDAVPVSATVTATDNCSTPVVDFNETSNKGTNPAACDYYTYTIWRTWTATDDCNNVTSSTQVITVEDKTAPVLAGVPIDVTVECDAVPAVATVTATDNCDPNPQILFSQVSTQGTDPSLCSYYAYTITRTWTAIDACGNSSTDYQTITVEDNTKPVITGPADITILKDANCNYNALPSITGYATATDNCATGWVVIDYTDVTNTGSCVGEHIITRTWTATDPCNNVSSTIQIITVQDKIAPVLVNVPAHTIVECDAVPAAAVVTATDNCDPNPVVSLVETSTKGTDPTLCSYYDYTITRTWTAIDACGNSSTDYQTITVEDNTKPVITGPADAIIYKDGSCGYDASPANTNGWATATDNCATGYVVIDYSDVTNTGSCIGEHIITRTWTATDPCNNVSSTVQIITVKDNTKPTITCATPASLYLMNNSCFYEAQGNEFDPTATGDNCYVASVTHNYTAPSSTTLAGALFPLGSTTVTWTIVDGCGNSETCTVVITVGGHTVTGKVEYFNPALTPMNNVGITLTQGTKVFNVTTGTNGEYSIADVCYGTFNVTFSTTKPVGGINSTDAAQVNTYGVGPYAIDVVRYLAGDVGPGSRDGYADGIDASQIVEFFITNGNPGTPFVTPWTFWKAGVTNTNTDPNQEVFYGVPTITVTGTQTENFYALVTGDFNRSFVPGGAKTGGNVILMNQGSTKVDAGMEVELPVTASFDMEVSAASLILNYPSDKAEIVEVTLGDNNGTVPFNAENGTLRIGWFDLLPLQLTTGEALFTIKVRTTGALTNGEVITFTLAHDPLNELADGSNLVIPAAVLNIGTIESTVGVEPILANDGNIGLMNFPNPFNQYTTFAYNIPVDGKVVMEVYDLLGRKVAQPVNETQTAGQYTFTVDTNDLRPGVYTATLRLTTTGGATMTRSIKIVSQK
jgi:hypothetical protein